MGAHRAIAEDGPLGSDPNLTVKDHDAEGRWPSPVVWKTGPAERHLYVLSDMALTPSGVPVYRYERSLSEDEPDPQSEPTKVPG